MGRHSNPSILALACLLILPSGAFAQLPMPTYGWNLGNTLEPPCGEGCWGPPVTQALINGVAHAGFNAVRIPCAWDSHANQSTYQIDPAFMARVQQVVSWCLATNLYVIINDHWDGGWLENNLTGTVNPTINAKMNSYWTQIATAFAAYDNRLLFAAANEPNVENAAEMSELMTYYDTFITAVRGTGGNNTSRWLVVQGPNTDIDTTTNLMDTLPTDPTPNRLMVEVHYYTPWNFCGMDQDESWGDMFYFWGQDYHSTSNPSRNATYGEEAYLDGQFQKMTDKFVSEGIPVMIGEFGAMKRTSLSEPDLGLHLASRTYFTKSVADSARSHGLSPFFWDTPGGGQAFDWTSGAVYDPDNVTALTGGPALPPPGVLPPVPLPWLTQDIGAVGLSGTAGYTNSVFTVVGAGADIQGAADAFHFVYVTATNNCTIIARVSSVQNVSAWSKAGVMIRASLDAGAANAYVAVTPGNGVTWQYRSSTNGGTTWNNTTGLTAPYWVKLVRSGNTLTAYRSLNGTNWTQQGTATFTMASTVYVGLALTSHDSSTLCTAAFDNVTAPGWPASTPPAAPTGLTAVAGDRAVALSWFASTTAANYYVKRSTTSGSGYTSIATNASLAFTNTGLANGTLYYFVVSAANAAGEGTSSTEVSARPTSLAPTQLGFVAAGNQFQLNWPSDHTGWQLQVQTNALSVGIGTNWSTVSGSTLTNQLTLPLNTANGAVFFRLVRP
jgi:regulation of enolase protein 1 (concanavalin A-like superfamily)